MPTGSQHTSTCPVYTCGNAPSQTRCSENKPLAITPASQRHTNVPASQRPPPSLPAPCTPARAYLNILIHRDLALCSYAVTDKNTGRTRGAPASCPSRPGRQGARTLHTGFQGNSGNSVRLYFLGLQNHCRW